MRLKYLLNITLSLILTACLSVSAFASTNETQTPPQIIPEESKTITLENGDTVEFELVPERTRTGWAGATYNINYNGTKVFTVRYRAAFEGNGQSGAITEFSMEQTYAKTGWSYKMGKIAYNRHIVAQPYTIQSKDITIYYLAGAEYDPNSSMIFLHHDYQGTVGKA